MSHCGEDADNEGGSAWVGQGDIWEPKTAVKNFKNIYFLYIIYNFIHTHIYISFKTIMFSSKENLMSSRKVNSYTHLVQYNCILAFLVCCESLGGL